RTKMKNKTEKNQMNHSRVVSRAEWLPDRLELLKEEKELTRRSDELARRRQELPWVRIDKQQRFETDEGSASLAALFRARSQLLVYHFMFGPDYTAGCPSLRKAGGLVGRHRGEYPLTALISAVCRRTKCLRRDKVSRSADTAGGGTCTRIR